jgi:hypothetical protein
MGLPRGESGRIGGKKVALTPFGRWPIFPPRSTRPAAMRRGTTAVLSRSDLPRAERDNLQSGRVVEPASGAAVKADVSAGRPATLRHGGWRGAGERPFGHVRHGAQGRAAAPSNRSRKPAVSFAPLGLRCFRGLFLRADRAAERRRSARSRPDNSRVGARRWQADSDRTTRASRLDRESRLSAADAALAHWPALCPLGTLRAVA